MQLYANYFYEVIPMFSSLGKCIDSNHCMLGIYFPIKLKIQTQTQKKLF